MPRKKKEQIEGDEPILVKKTRKPRKKNEVVEEKEFIPSKYQSDFFDWVIHGHGNAVLEASAGSGKSTTIIQAIKLIDSDKSILFSAFNRDIVKSLKKKIGNVDNVDVRTIHSLGYLMLQRNFPTEKLIIDEYKYYTHIRENLSHYSNGKSNRLSRSKWQQFFNNVCKLVEFARFNLISSISDIEIVADRYNVFPIENEAEIALKVLSWGSDNLECIDYTDMIWLPNVLRLSQKGLQYDWVLTDECQDLSIAQREMLFKVQKMGTRFVFVGDKSQSIYGFNGSLPEQFEELKNLPNTISLPLSISYRCAKNIVKFAQGIEPSIEWNEDGREGQVVNDCKLEDVNDGDMVLCRNNKPLIELYNTFIMMGKTCYINGKDIGLNLKKMIKQTKKEELNRDLNNDGVFVRLYDSFFDLRNDLIKTKSLDKSVVMENESVKGLLDCINALEILADGINTKDELINKIDSIFSDKKKKDGITLSTVHKAKGLEADNVYIICRNLLGKNGQQPWEKKQERNLMYVAYTRAKNKLGFIPDNEFTTSKVDVNDNLKVIENKVCKILNKKVLTDKDISINNNPSGIPIDNSDEVIPMLKCQNNSKILSHSNERNFKRSFADLNLRKRR